jgi:hypothetical protein
MESSHAGLTPRTHAVPPRRPLHGKDANLRHADLRKVSLPANHVERQGRGCGEESLGQALFSFLFFSRQRPWDSSGARAKTYAVPHPKWSTEKAHVCFRPDGRCAQSCCARSSRNTRSIVTGRPARYSLYPCHGFNLAGRVATVASPTYLRVLCTRWTSQAREPTASAAQTWRAAGPSSALLHTWTLAWSDITRTVSCCCAVVVFLYRGGPGYII